MEVFKQVAEHTAAMNRCAVEFGPRFKALCGPVINDKRYAAIAREALLEILGEECVVSGEPWYASESFPDGWQPIRGYLPTWEQKIRRKVLERPTTTAGLTWTRRCCPWV